MVKDQVKGGGKLEGGLIWCKKKMAKKDPNSEGCKSFWWTCSKVGPGAEVVGEVESRLVGWFHTSRQWFTVPQGEFIRSATVVRKKKKIASRPPRKRGLAQQKGVVGHCMDGK